MRGLGNVEKCKVVRSIIKEARCEVCCIQEIKWNCFDSSYFDCVLPSYFERRCVFIDAINTSGDALFLGRSQGPL